MRRLPRRFLVIATAFVLLAFSHVASLGQTADSEKPKQEKPGKGVRVVTIPVSTRTRGKERPEEGSSIDFVLKENGDEEKILSIRGIGGNPMSLAVLIQDDLVSSVATDIKAIGDFIKHLPRGSRVMIAYMKTGSLDIRQKFTPDLDKAAAQLRVPIGFASATPADPYLQIKEGLKRFDSLAAGRRAMLIVSDGLDTRAGLDSSQPGQSPDLEAAITQAQRSSVAVYSIYAPSVTAEGFRNPILIQNGQGSLAKLADETGGRSYTQGLSAPVSFGPFLDEVAEALSRQFAITYLSSHPQKGFHRIELTSDRPDMRLDYPRGYLY